MRQAVIISGLIFTYVCLTQYGRRSFAWHRWLPPVLAIPVVAVIYLSRATMTGADILLYATATVIGAVFGVLATVTTALERDADSHRLYTRCGIPFAVVWLVALGSRVAFVWALQDNDTVRAHVGQIMREHQIAPNAIAPTFVFIALLTFGIRIVGLALRARNLPRASSAVGQ